MTDSGGSHPPRRTVSPHGDSTKDTQVTQGAAAPFLLDTYLSTGDPLAWMVDCLDEYLRPRLPFQPRYTYSELISDLSFHAGGDAELVADFLDLQHDVPDDEEARANYIRRRKRDTWLGYPKLSARARGQLAERRTPFFVLGVRRHRAQKQRKAWENSVDLVWQLLIQNDLGLIPRSILTLAPHPARNQILDKLAGYFWAHSYENPSYGPVFLYWKPMGRERNFLALGREER